jgi:hypothetical protein
VNRFLRGQAIAAFVVAPPVAVFMNWGRLRNMDEVRPGDDSECGTGDYRRAQEGIADRAYRIRMNTSQTRCDDYSTVGAVLGALLTTTIFLKRACVSPPS